MELHIQHIIYTNEITSPSSLVSTQAFKDEYDDLLQEFNSNYYSHGTSSIKALNPYDTHSIVTTKADIEGNLIDTTCINTSLSRTMKFTQSCAQRSWFGKYYLKQPNIPIKDLIRPCILVFEQSRIHRLLDNDDAFSYDDPNVLDHMPWVKRIHKSQIPIEFIIRDRNDLPSPKYVIVPRKYKIRTQGLLDKSVSSIYKDELNKMFPNTTLIELDTPTHLISNAGSYIRKSHNKYMYNELMNYTLKGKYFYDKKDRIVKSTGEEQRTVFASIAMKAIKSLV